MGTSISPSEIKRFEVTEVYTHPDAKVDIILVHGLNGDPQKTWTAKNGTFWPTDLLPVTLKSAKARILVYGYNADVYAFGGDRSASSDMIHQHAQTMVTNLSLERKSEERAECPIIWVAHSLGGILLKRALELANDLTSKSSDDNRSIYVSTYGIIFLGTPHTGSDPAKWGHMLQSMCDAMIPKKVMDTEPHLVRTLRSNNEVLQNINLHFLDIYQRFEISMVHEAVKTDLKGTKAFVVEQGSASPQLPNVNYYGIEATHSGMCKFENKRSPGYLNVSTTIKSWVMAAPPVIESRWMDEERYRAQLKEVQAKEILGLFTPRNSSLLSSKSPDSLSRAMTPDLIPTQASKTSDMTTSIIQSVASIAPSSVDPLFIKPPGFRPNSIFVGRTAELAQMHKLLFDEKRRSQGTSAILIQSLPGGGKTHLAREYVYSHMKDFPGGIFWVRAKSTEQMAAGFWDIARKTKLHPSEENLRDPQGFINSVVTWLRDRVGWLLIFDGIQFNHSEDLRRFIPDAPDTAIIYTSTDKGGAGDHHFMNPKTVRLPLLSAREARDLLLAELDKSETANQDELVHAMELVQRMEFLPLAIHTVAKRLKSTEEPLGRFLKSWKSQPRLRGVGALEAVVEDLKAEKAVEGLNLMRLLCFWSQHVPVEMISLGLKSLDIPVMAYESETGRSLNNTFKVLNKFALIDRNEEDMFPPSNTAIAITNSSDTIRSTGSASSRDMLSDNVDVIRIHSVIQDFCVDSVRANGDLPVWLSRAVKLFVGSFEEADSRIKKRSKGGLVEDYRLYEIHGKKLLVHIRHLEKHGGRFEERGALERILEAVKGEIERRTMHSSQELAKGGKEAFQISIFDRYSSSSDAGPETPGGEHGILWGKGQHESPVSIKGHDHDEAFDWRGRLSTKRDGIELNLPLRTHKDPEQRQKFPPLVLEDRGYLTDHEDLPPRIGRPGTSSPTGVWEVVPNTRGRSRGRSRPTAPETHRTVLQRNNKRYRDSAGAWRSMGPAAVYDPRVENAYAKGFLDVEQPRTPSRNQMSGKSMAEVALTTISKESPPPIRGGGHIQDRRQSAGRVGRLGATATYAAAVAQSDRATSAEMQRARSDETGRVSRPLFSLAEKSLKQIPTLCKPLPGGSAQAAADAGEYGQEAIRRVDVRQEAREGFYQQPYPNSDASINRLAASHSQDILPLPQFAPPYVSYVPSASKSYENIAQPQPYIAPYALNYSSRVQSNDNLPARYALSPFPSQEHLPLPISPVRAYSPAPPLPQAQPQYYVPSSGAAYGNRTLYGRNETPLLVETVNYPPSRIRHRGLTDEFVPRKVADARTTQSSPGVQPTPFAEQSSTFRVQDPRWPDPFAGYERAGGAASQAYPSQAQLYADEVRNISQMGYTSQPMSRHMSSQSNMSYTQSDLGPGRLQPFGPTPLDHNGSPTLNNALNLDPRFNSGLNYPSEIDDGLTMPDYAHRRSSRASVALTEPSPRMPNLSPKAPMGSYQLYHSQELPPRQSGLDYARPQEYAPAVAPLGLGIQTGAQTQAPGQPAEGLPQAMPPQQIWEQGHPLAKKKSPRLGFARKALIESMGNGGSAANIGTVGSADATVRRPLTGFNPNARIFNPLRRREVAVAVPAGAPAYHSSPVSRVGEREDGAEGLQAADWGAVQDGKDMVRTGSGGFAVGPDGSMFVGFGDAEPVEVREARRRVERVGRRRGLSSPEARDGNGRRSYFE